MYAFLDQEYFGLKAWVVILGCENSCNLELKWLVKKFSFYRPLIDEQVDFKN